MNEPDHEHCSLYCVFICALRGSKPAKICQGFLDVLKVGNVEVIVALQIYAVSREKETLFEHKQCSEIIRLDNYSTWNWKCRAATNVSEFKQMIPLSSKYMPNCSFDKYFFSLHQNCAL